MLERGLDTPKNYDCGHISASDSVGVTPSVAARFRVSVGVTVIPHGPAVALNTLVVVALPAPK